MSSVFAAVIVGALCFSVGEGLRLTPFTVSTFSQTEDAQYGPLNVPAQNQKRSKRQVDVAVPAATGTRDSFPESSHIVAGELIDVASVLFVPGPSGRAPPFLF